MACTKGRQPAWRNRSHFSAIVREVPSCVILYAGVATEDWESVPYSHRRRHSYWREGAKCRGVFRARRNTLGRTLREEREVERITRQICLEFQPGLDNGRWCAGGGPETALPSQQLSIDGRCVAGPVFGPAGRAVSPLSRSALGLAGDSCPNAHRSDRLGRAGSRFVRTGSSGGPQFDLVRLCAARRPGVD